MSEVQNITDGRPDGAVIGASATEKIGFFGATPVVQQTGAVAVATTAATSTSPFGFTEAQANAIIAGINALDTALTNLGLTA